MLKIKIKKLATEAVLPQYAKPGDAGLDVYAVSRIETEKYIEYGTGIAFELTEGYVMLVFPRSSISNTHLILANSVGVLDSGYRGELKLRFRKTGEAIYEIGDKVGQIMILPYPQIEFEETEELAESVRGVGGFGSSGQK